MRFTQTIARLCLALHFSAQPERVVNQGGNSPDSVFLDIAADYRFAAIPAARTDDFMRNYLSSTLANICMSISGTIPSALSVAVRYAS